MGAEQAPGRPTGEPPTPPIRLQLEGTQETLVIPLYARALDYRSRRSVLHDARSSEIVEAIDFDFERLRSPGRINLLPIRARLLDDWVRAFLAAHPGALVVNLGCGLDPRVERIRPPSGALWLDLDLPEVIELRRRFFRERTGYRMVAASATDPGWLVPLPKERAVLAIADGVLEYLPPDEVAALFRRILDAFPEGELVFDVMSSAALSEGNARLAGRTGARLRWSVDDLRPLDALDRRWRRTGTRSPLASRLLPPRYWMLALIARLSPRVGATIRVLRYDFGP